MTRPPLYTVDLSAPLSAPSAQPISTSQYKISAPLCHIYPSTYICMQHLHVQIEFYCTKGAHHPARKPNLSDRKTKPNSQPPPPGRKAADPNRQGDVIPIIRAGLAYAGRGRHYITCHLCETSTGLPESSAGGVELYASRTLRTCLPCVWVAG